MTDGGPAGLRVTGPPLLVVLSGPSGAGKDAILACLKRRGLPFHFTITATTRAPRGEERDGVDYYFLSDAAFDRLLAEHGLLEHAQVYGHRSGVPRAPIVEALGRGQDVVMRTDVQGAASIRRLCPQAVLVFVSVSSLDELETRLRRRGVDGEESLRRRLQTAEAEMARIPEFDYLVLNEPDRLQDTADVVLAIMTAEKCRVGRTPPQL